MAGAVVAGAASWAGHRRGALTADGAWAGFISGTAVSAGGWRCAVAMLTLFASGSALSGLPHGKAAALAAIWEKGDRRDAVQVLANGGLATAAAVVAAVRPGPLPLAACLGGLAASNADTWSTEIGVLSPTPPRRITDGRLVPTGESGGVTALGLIGGGLGAALIAAIGAAAEPPRLRLGRFAGVLLAGIFGALADSVVGATAQATYSCPRCRVTTEQRRHACGTPTQLCRGYGWITNDVVNACATAAGAVVALIWEAGALSCRDWREGTP